MSLMRDHYEGTPYDMTKGIDAGPFSSPLRLRDLAFSVDGKKYMWERPISTQQAGFVVVTQSRKELPDPIGGVTWFTPDEASTSCFTPLYCSIGTLPEAYTRGDYKKFSWDSAWWVTNLVSNLAYDRWSRVFPDIQQAQSEQEMALLKMQPIIEETAAKLAATDTALDELIPDQLFRVDRRCGVSPLARPCRGDPVPARRWLYEGPEGFAQGTWLRPGMASRSRQVSPRAVQAPRESSACRDRSLRIPAARMLVLIL